MLTKYSFFSPFCCFPAPPIFPQARPRKGGRRSPSAPAPCPRAGQIPWECLLLLLPVLPLKGKCLLERKVRPQILCWLPWPWRGSPHIYHPDQAHGSCQLLIGASCSGEPGSPRDSAARPQPRCTGRPPTDLPQPLTTSAADLSVWPHAHHHWATGRQHTSPATNA